MMGPCSTPVLVEAGPSHSGAGECGRRFSRRRARQRALRSLNSCSGGHFEALLDGVHATVAAFASDLPGIFALELDKYFASHCLLALPSAGTQLPVPVATAASMPMAAQAVSAACAQDAEPPVRPWPADAPSVS